MSERRSGHRALAAAALAALLVLAGTFLWRSGPVHAPMSADAPMSTEAGPTGGTP